MPHKCPILPKLLEAQSAPAAPTGLSVSRADGTVTASWPEVSGVASYHVTYSSDGENSGTAAPCGNNCTVGNNGVSINEGVVSITITGADNSKTYVVGVRASDNGGQWSGWTNSASIAPQLPAAPASVTLTRAAGQLTVTWTAVSAATSYNVNISGDGTNSWTRAVSGATGTGNTITKTIDTGIDNWRWYIAAVQSVNDKGAGGWTNSEFVGPIYTPGQVSDLSATRSGTGISVTWNAPANNGGSAVTSYDVNYTLDGVHSWMRAISNQSATSATIPNVSNGVGEGGAWTNSAPVAGLAGPSTVSAVKGGDYIEGEWTAVAGATGYDVNLLYFQNEYHYRIETNMTGTSRRIYINDGSYFSPEQFVIAVRARNAHGPGAWVNSPPATPAPTLAVSGVNATDATLKLSNHAAAWWYKSTTTGKTTCASVAANTASTNVTGLTPLTAYTFTAYRDSGCATSLAAASAFTTGGVSVSNLGESGTSPSFLTLTQRWATAFTTGSNSSGYTLHSATMPLSRNASGGTVTWTIRTGKTSGDNVVPSDTVEATLASGAIGTSTSNVINTCTVSQSHSCALQKDTTYFVVGTLTGSGDPQVLWNYTSSFNETLVPSGNGWSIAEGWRSQYNSSAWGEWTTYATNTANDVNKVKIVAIPNLTLSATSLTSITATLTIVNHTAAWWYKRTSPTGDATCHSVAADTATDSLTGLTSGTSYTYKAYDKSGCASADEIASVTFTQVTAGSRDSSKDFNTLSAAGNNGPDGIWSDGTTMWVSDFSDGKVYAYNLATKARDTSKEISFSGISIPLTLGADGTTMWIASYTATSKLFAYSISGKSRDTSKDVTVHTDNTYSTGLWTNGTTIWVADATDTYIYAYTIANGARDTGKEIDLHTDNGSVNGLWSDGVTIWVSDLDDDKLYAYNLSNGNRNSSKDYDSEDGNIYGIWSDGATMWIADDGSDKIFAYHSIDPGAKLTVASVSATTATLYLGAHTGSWYVKETSPATNADCSSEITGTTHTLSSLTAGTSYTYKAYDKSECASADEIASVTFTTPSS